MNFEPSIILGQLAGNNADARSVSVRVMNDTTPTPKQLAALAQRFELHKTAVRYSLAGFLTSDGLLADGSAYRVVTNSGVHVVMLWPAPVPVPETEAVADWFRTIPVTDALTLGSGSKPSYSWKIPKKVDAWPTALKGASAVGDHPGHITWSNPDLTYKGKPIVLAWRGPRDRYAATTGFDGTIGGSIVAHEDAPFTFPNPSTFANQVLTDTGYVWINGHKVNTSLQKVIAACLCQYDPIGAPGKFVLRVASDMGVANARQMRVVDLVPKAGMTGAGLESFATAKTLAVKATYVATKNKNGANFQGSSNTPGDWDYWQRPHFNKSGTRLATIICMVGANGTDRESHAVSFNPTTWAIVDDVVASITGTWTSDWTGQFVDFHTSANNTRDTFIAADFEGDTFVYMKYRIVQAFTESGRDDGLLAGTIHAGYKTINDSHTFSFHHSVLGKLKEFTTTEAFHTDYSVASAGTGFRHVTASYSNTITNGWRAVGDGWGATLARMAFVGDLSKRTFAIGYPKQGDASYSGAGSIDATYSTSDPYPSIPVNATAHRARLLFDVYFDGAKVLDAGTGGFADSAVAVTAGSYSSAPTLSTVQPENPRVTTTNNNAGELARFVQAAPQSPPSFEGRFGSGASNSTRACIYNNAAAPLYQHCAVEPLKRAAYFGAAYFEDTYGSTPVVQGLETTIVVPETTPIVDNPPIYAAGVHPTMAVPVFMGTASSGAPP